jgi:hypothetical protein
LETKSESKAPLIISGKTGKIILKLILNKYEGNVNAIHLTESRGPQQDVVKSYDISVSRNY